MNVIVTGATSFIGAVTVGQLLEDGHRVCAVVRPASRGMEYLRECISRGCDRQEDTSRQDILEKRKDRLMIRELALEQIGNLKDDLASETWDGWIHIGWEGAGSGNRMLRKVQQGNVEYSLAAVRTAADLGCRRFLFTGSQAEYGIHYGPVTEDTACDPVSEYGKAKLDFANLAKELCKSRKMEYIHTRIFSVYGPGDHPWSLVSTCLNTWMRGEQMKLGECTQKWNFLYVDDAASALVHLLTEGQPGIYNVAGEDTRVLREFIEEMYELCKRRGSYVYGVRLPNAEGPAPLMPEITRLLAQTSWRPATSFREGIYETMHRLRQETAR